jgi:hypothetical protein
MNPHMPKLDQKNNPLCVIGEVEKHPFLSRLLHRFAEKSEFKIQPNQTG